MTRNLTNHQNHQNNQLNHKLIRYISAFVFELSKNEKQINKLSSYFCRGDLGTRLNNCFQKFEQLLKEAKTIDYIFLTNFVNSFKNIISENFGTILLYWLGEFLRFWYYLDSDSEYKKIIESSYNATINLGKKFKLSVKDKNFYTLLLPAMKLIYANQDLPVNELKTKLFESLEKTMRQSIYCRAHWGRARYLGKRSTLVLEPSIYVMYIFFQIFIQDKNMNYEAK